MTYPTCARALMHLPPEITSAVWIAWRPLSASPRTRHVT